MLKIQNISKSYGNQKVLDIRNLEIQKGDILGLLGPNGAGKSTCMKILAGILEADELLLSWANFRTGENLLKLNTQIGYLPERVPLYPEMRVKEYLNFVAELRGIEKQSRVNRINELIEELDLSNVLNRLCSKLSKGYQQRLGIAQAIIHKPELIILDEPFSGLDPKQVVELRNILLKHAKNSLIIVSSHLLSQMEQLCTQLVFISEGKLVKKLYLNDKGNLNNRWKIQFRASSLDFIEDIKNEYDLDLIDIENNTLYLLSAEQKSSLVQSLVNANVAVEELQEIKSNLENEYLKYTLSTGEKR